MVTCSICGKGIGQTASFLMETKCARQLVFLELESVYAFIDQAMCRVMRHYVLKMLLTSELLYVFLVVQLVHGSAFKVLCSSSGERGHERRFCTAL